MDEHISSNTRLKVSEKLRQSFVAKYLANPRMLILLVLLITLVGVFSFLNIPRVLNPSIDIAIVNVVTAMPGASPEDIESLVTIPIEDQVKGVSSVKKVTSTSQDSISIVSIEFNSGVDPEKARTDIQSAVDTAILPADVPSPPKVQKLDFQNAPVWSFTITSKEDIASLTRFAKDLKERIDGLAEVGTITISGVEEQEIEVIIKPEAISTYGINNQALSGAIRNSLQSFPAGNVRTEKGSFALTIDPAVTKIEDLRDVKLNLKNSVVSLSDVAVVVERSKPEQPGSFFAAPNTPPTRSINIDVYKTSSAQIEATSKKAQELVDQVLKEYDYRFEVHSSLNTADLISNQFTELTRDFWITIGLVFLTLLFFLGLRQAVVSVFAIPLTFFITFTVMRLSGIDFSFIAFFSLLLSLGLLVDDTIVVISAMTSYFRVAKLPPIETGLLVWRDFVVAIFTTTLTTVWAFFPLLLSSGIIGEFIKPIPIVVSTTLMASFFVAMFITLPFMVIILKPYIPRRVQILTRIMLGIVIVGIFIALVPKTTLLLLQVLVFLVLLLIFINVRDILWSRLVGLIGRRVDTRRVGQKFKARIDNGVISFDPITIRYQRIISRILSTRSGVWKTVLIVVVFFIFSIILFPLGFVKNEFFPSGDADYLYVSLELPAGTNSSVTAEESKKLLNDLRQTKGLDFAIASLGRGIGPTGFSSSGNNTSLITLVLYKLEDREKTSIDIAEEIREKYANYQNGKVSVIEESGGPPAGADLQIKLFGPDLNRLDTYADKVVDYLKTQQGVTDADKSIKAGTSKITFVPDQSKLAENNLTLDQVGFTLRTLASGFKADDIKLEGDKETTDITIRFGENTQYAESISKLMVTTQTGLVIPLISLGELKLAPNPTLITREDGNRTISVSAGVSDGFNIQDKNKELEKYANDLKLPSGYGWQTGGVNEENQNSVNSILQAMILSFLLIIVTMVIQFSSFRDALIVMLVIPLAVSGVFIIFALAKIPLSFPALIGVLALFGIVVKNSILLVDKINQNKKAGMELKNAISDASATRIEPIFLTSFATIMGLVPITLSDPLWRGLGGAIIAGLTFSGTIMLFFIPVVYYLFFRNDARHK